MVLDLVRPLLLGLSGLAAIGLFIAVLVGMLVHGPRLWVRLCTVGLVLAGLANTALLVSPRAALGLLAFLVVTMVLSSVVTLFAWSMPADPTPEPHAFDPPDPGLRALAERWGAELDSLGYRHALDLCSSYRLGGSVRRTWTRVFTHGERAGWLELGVLVQPKVAALRAVTPLADGRTLETSNRRTDAATLGDAGTAAVKVPEGARVVDLLLAHDRGLAEAGAGASPLPTPDVLAARLASHRAFVERMIAGGVLARHGDQLRLRPRALPRLLAHSFTALVRG